MAEATRLLLLANEAEEVPLISALVQDAVVHAGDVAWQPTARRLVLLVNRFRWEAGNAVPTRVRCALRLENVTRLQRRAWGPAVILDLLAVTVEDDGAALTLAFAGGPTLRAAVECIDLILEDIGEPWPASREPAHDDGR